MSVPIFIFAMAIIVVGFGHFMWHAEIFVHEFHGDKLRRQCIYGVVALAVGIIIAVFGFYRHGVESKRDAISEHLNMCIYESTHAAEGDCLRNSANMEGVGQ